MLRQPSAKLGICVLTWPVRSAVCSLYGLRFGLTVKEEASNY